MEDSGDRQFVWLHAFRKVDPADRANRQAEDSHEEEHADDDKRFKCLLVCLFVLVVKQEANCDKAASHALKENARLKDGLPAEFGGQECGCKCGRQFLESHKCGQEHGNLRSSGLIQDGSAVYVVSIDAGHLGHDYDVNAHNVG